MSYGRSSGGDPLAALALDAVEGVPQRLGGSLSGLQGSFFAAGVIVQLVIQLPLPGRGVIDVGDGVQVEVAAGDVIGTVLLTQLHVFLAGDTRDLRFVSPESG